jgi:LPXTG-motif cell wall-anchored protein
MLTPRQEVGVMGMLRTGAALLTAALMVGGGGLLASGTAHARTGTPWIEVAGTYYMATGPSQDDADDAFIFNAHAADGSTPQKSVVTIDASAFAGKASLRDVEYRCGHTGLISTCDFDTPHPYAEPFMLRALDESSVGFTGDLVLTLTIPGSAPVTASVHTIIGQPDLESATPPMRSGVAPGSVVEQRPVITNKGQVAGVKGFSVLFTTSDAPGAPDGPGFVPEGPRYRNCHYQSTPGTAFVCAFDQDIAPGTAYTTDAALPYRIEPVLMEGALQYLPEQNDIYPSFSVGAGSKYPYAGDGPLLGLTSTTPPTGDVSRTGYFKVSTTQHADYEAIGADITGKTGATVDVSVGARNKGPGVLWSNQDFGFVNVTLPEGVAMVDTPRCDLQKQPARTYRCDIDGALGVGRTSYHPIKVRVDRAVTGAVGKVTYDQAVDHDNGDALLTRDDDLANDVAPLTVHVTPASSSGGTSTSGGGASTPGGSPKPTSAGATTDSTPSAASAAPSPTTPDGSLAATGTSDTWPMTATAAATLLAGAAAFVSARRRRRG